MALIRHLILGLVPRADQGSILFGCRRLVRSPEKELAGEIFRVGYPELEW